MKSSVPELAPICIEGDGANDDAAEQLTPNAESLRLALLSGDFEYGTFCLVTMREDAIFDAGLGHATTHALLAARTALIDNEDPRDAMALWAICRARVLQQLSREWEDGDGPQGLQYMAAADEFIATVCDESARLPSATTNAESGVLSIPLNVDNVSADLRELQGHMLRVESIIAQLRGVRARIAEEYIALSLGVRSEVSTELSEAIERVRKLDENPRAAVIQAVLDAAGEWTPSDATRNRTMCDGAAIGLAEALGRTDTTDWAGLLYEAARAKANPGKFGSWYVATLALMERLDLEYIGASTNVRRRKNLERDVSEFKKAGRVIETRRAG